MAIGEQSPSSSGSVLLRCAQGAMGSLLGVSSSGSARVRCHAVGVAGSGPSVRWRSAAGTGDVRRRARCSGGCRTHEATRPARLSAVPRGECYRAWPAMIGGRCGSSANRARCEVPGDSEGISHLDGSNAARHVKRSMESNERRDEFEYETMWYRDVGRRCYGACYGAQT